MPDGLLSLLAEVAPSAEPIIRKVLGSMKKEDERDRIAQQLFLALIYEDAHKTSKAIEGLVAQNEKFAVELGEAMAIAQDGIRIARAATRQVARHSKAVERLGKLVEERLPAR